MVAIYCSHCAVVFPSLTVLHGHVKKLVPYGSYTFDFKSQTGYPNKDPFPFINLSYIKREKQLRTELRQKERVDIRVYQKANKAKKNLRNRKSRVTTISKLKIKEECNAEGEITNETVTHVGDLNVNEEINTKENHDTPSYAECCEDVMETDDIQNCNEKELADIRYVDNDNNDCGESKTEFNTGNHKDDKDYDCGERNADIHIGNDNDDKKDDYNVESNVDINDGCDGDDYEEKYSDIGDDIDDYGGTNTDIDDNYDGDDDNDCRTSDVEKYGSSKTINKAKKKSEVYNHENREKNEKEFDAGSEENQRPSRKCRKRANPIILPISKKIRKKINLNKGRKKYYICEFCGSKMDQYLLVDHIESVHSEEKLSENLLQTMQELREKKKNREIALSKDSDSDWDPSKDENKVSNFIKRTPHSDILNEMLTHKYLEHKGKYIECDLCGLFIRRNLFLKHKKYHDTRTGKLKYRPENITQCETCGRRSLKGHIKKHICFAMLPLTEAEKQREREKVMEEDKATEQDEDVVKKEKKNIDKNERIPCHICGVLMKRSNIKKHMYKHGGSKAYTCETCGKSFFMKSQLNQHQIMSHGERTFQCDHCPYAFTSAHTLRVHMRVHSDVKKYICSICGEGFKWTRSLESHEITHTGILKHACNYCGKKFTRSNNLQTHVKNVHEQVKEWICSWPECNKRLGCGPRLRRHMIIHSGEKPVKCTHCTLGFTQRGELKTHLKKKHNTDVMPPSTNVTFYTGLPQVIIRNPVEGDQPINLKTFFFPSKRNISFEGLVVEEQDPTKMPLHQTRKRARSISEQTKQRSVKASKDLKETTSQCVELQDHVEQIKSTSRRTENQFQSSQNQFGQVKSTSHQSENQFQSSQNQFGQVKSTSHQSENQFQSSQDQSEPSMFTVIDSKDENKSQHLQSQEHTVSVQQEEDLEAVARLATTSALEAISLETVVEPIENSHIASSSSSENQHLLFTPDKPVSSLIKKDPELDINQEHNWTQFQ